MARDEKPILSETEKTRIASDPRASRLWDEVCEAAHRSGLEIEENGPAEKALYDACLLAVHLADTPARASA